MFVPAGMHEVHELLRGMERFSKHCEPIDPAIQEVHRSVRRVMAAILLPPEDRPASSN